MKSGGLILGGLATFTAVVLGLVLGLASMSGASANPCTPSTAGTINPDAIPADANVSGFGREQLANAAAIMNAASAMKLPAAAQTIGVQAAIGESSLVNINYGDNAINPDGSVADSIGLFQQQGSWGTVAERMDPPTAARLFYKRLVTVPGWEQLEPSIAINKVQINSDPFHYVKFRPGAIAVTDFLAKLAGASGSACSVSADAQQLAKTLVAAREAGTLTDYQPQVLDELNGIADGTASPDCQIDVRVLQVLVLVLNKYGSVGISDMNRPCVGDDLHCEFSAHCMKPAKAVDFNSVGGRPTNGYDSDATVELLTFLDPIVPKGSNAGQIACRDTHSFTNWSEFDDPCTHQHIDFGYTDAPLNIPG